MKEKRKYRGLLARASVFAVLAVMLAVAAIPVWGDSTGSSGNSEPYTITFQDDKGAELAAFPADKDDTWGPAGTVSVRSTYYKDGRDYDIVKGGLAGKEQKLDAGSKELQSGARQNVEGNMTFVYKQHTDSSGAQTALTYKCMAEDGTLLATYTDKNKIPSTLNSGSKVYARSSKANDSKDPSVVNVYYTLKEDTDTSYTVMVQYIDDADGSVITTRSFSVNNRQHTFIAPKYFSVSSSGKTVGYRAVGDTTIIHKVSDTTRTYKIHYKKLNSNSGEPYNWYILFYSSDTNKCIGSDTVKVKAGETAKYSVQSVLSSGDTSDGRKYTINKHFADKTLKHEYSDTNHTAYVYYDPEGYENSSDVKKKDINIQYVNIADGSVLQSRTQTVTSEGNTTLTFPESFDAGGIHYLRVEGQAASVDYSYYSPKTVYTVYYYDKNNTQFRKTVITREEVQEVLINGPTTYRVIPGITRTVASNTDNGVRNVLSANDASGAPIAQTSAGNINTGRTSGTGNTASETGIGTSGTGNGTSGTASAGNGGSQDVTVDGVPADDIQTPQGNINLDSEKDSGKSAKVIPLVIGGAALAAFVIAAAILLIRRSRSKRES